MYVEEKSLLLINYFLLWVLVTNFMQWRYKKYFKYMKTKFSAQLFLRNSSHWPRLYNLSSKRTRQLEVLYVRTFGNIQENFLNETLFCYFTNKPAKIIFLEIYESFETTSTILFLENCHSIYSRHDSHSSLTSFLYFLCLILI